MTLPSVITSQPQTINSLQYNQFRFVLNRMPNTVYFCQGVKFPGIQSQPITQPSPFATPIKRTPTRLGYDDLQIDFIVSEDFKLLKEVIDDLKSVTGSKEIKEGKSTVIELI